MGRMGGRRGARALASGLVAIALGGVAQAAGCEQAMIGGQYSMMFEQTEFPDGPWWCEVVVSAAGSTRQVTCSDTRDRQSGGITTDIAISGTLVLDSYCRVGGTLDFRFDYKNVSPDMVNRSFDMKRGRRSSKGDLMALGLQRDPKRFDQRSRIKVWAIKN